MILFLKSYILDKILAIDYILIMANIFKPELCVVVALLCVNIYILKNLFLELND